MKDSRKKSTFSFENCIRGAHHFYSFVQLVAILRLLGAGRLVASQGALCPQDTAMRYLVRDTVIKVWEHARGAHNSLPLRIVFMVLERFRRIIRRVHETRVGGRQYFFEIWNNYYFLPCWIIFIFRELIHYILKQFLNKPNTKLDIN